MPLNPSFSRSSKYSVNSGRSALSEMKTPIDARCGIDALADCERWRPSITMAVHRRGRGPPFPRRARRRRPRQPVWRTGPRTGGRRTPRPDTVAQARLEEVPARIGVPGDRLPQPADARYPPNPEPFVDRRSALEDCHSRSQGQSAGARAEQPAPGGAAPTTEGPIRF